MAQSFQSFSVPEIDKELVYTPVTKYHIGQVNYYSRDVVIYDSETQTEISRTKEYSGDGVNWVNVAPIGVPIIGWYALPVLNTAYNINEVLVNSGINPIILSGNTYHAVSIAILAESATISINGVAYIATAGYSDSWESTTTLVNPITITPSSVTSVVVVNTIK